MRPGDMSTSGDVNYLHVGSHPDFTEGNVSSVIYTTPTPEPELLSTEIFADKIELVYKEATNQYISVSHWFEHINYKVYKIVFSCKGGKWHQSERIYAEITPAQEESYCFPETKEDLQNRTIFVEGILHIVGNEQPFGLELEEEGVIINATEEVVFHKYMSTVPVGGRFLIWEKIAPIKEITAYAVLP